MSYEQHMKHWGNHRKDRYYQQCSGYGGNGVETVMSDETIAKLEVESMRKILTTHHEFPIYIRQCGAGYWCTVSEKDWFGTEIVDMEHLIQFINRHTEINLAEYADIINDNI